MGRWEIPVRVVAQGGFATTLAGSMFHCRAANALRHAHIAVIKHILKKKRKHKTIKTHKLRKQVFEFFQNNGKLSIISSKGGAMEHGNNGSGKHRAEQCGTAMRALFFCRNVNTP
ncbi:hypothetical protein D9C73_010866 [Collichthys lucidus]|uniref:Uncharacterized protein n=1 Tax=Collichthys lucidus TaxID=240159 RepID=A0A4U5UP34_COLLU|nr:hypothetical protein D9C73_010866 [Collichthys lucidus]